MGNGAIHLSKIHFRPYSEGEEPTEFGPVDYTPAPGVIDLSTIKFRPWSNSGVVSIGGEAEPGGGGGGGGPGGGDDGGGVDLGEFAFLINGLSEDAAAWKTFTGVTEIYGRVAFFISSAQMASWLPGNQFGGDFIELASDDDPLFSWTGLYLTNRNTSNAVDGNMYVTNFFDTAANRKLVTPDTWHIGEIGMKVVGLNYQENWRWDGVEATWQNVTGTINIPTGITTFVVGNQYNETNGYWYLDNAMYSTTNWVSSGGAVVFQDGFESGDFSQWTGTYGSVQVVAYP